MPANVYSVQNLLVGKQYFSNSLEGIIINAEPHPSAVWYEGCDSYLVEVQSRNSIKTKFRTVAVKVGA
jgi:hypothetical protein